MKTRAHLWIQHFTLQPDSFYQEEMITSVLDLSRADRAYVRDSMKSPPFLAKHWRAMVQEVKRRAHTKPK